MRKFTLLLSLTILLSCATKNSVSNQQKAPAVPHGELEAMYVRMVTSEEYKAYDTAIASYLDKLNILHNDYLLDNGFNLLTSDSDEYKWIAENLADTKFTSVEEAKQENENITKLLEKVLENHQAVFDTYGDEANHKILNELSRKYDPEYTLK